MKEYKRPEIRVSAFSKEDIVRASNTGGVFESVGVDTSEYTGFVAKDANDLFKLKE